MFIGILLGLMYLIDIELIRKRFDGWIAGQGTELNSL